MLHIQTRFKLLLLLVVLSRAENEDYYGDQSDASEYYDMTDSSDSGGDYSDYSDVQEFDASGTEDDMIDDPNDLHMIGEVSFDGEDSNSVGLSSVLGQEEGADGFKSANPDNHFNAASEHQSALFRKVDMFRRGKKKKRRRKPRPSYTNKNKPMFTSKKPTYRLKKGAISAFEEAVIVKSSPPANCNRGWHDNNKNCANSCRVAWLEGNPRKNWKKKNPAEYYKKNPKHTTCEACAMWSKLVNPQSPAFFQKSLSNLRGGAPTLCQVGTPDCDARERDFAACMGTDVCADACWSPIANKGDCAACKAEFCNVSYKAKYYKICQVFDRCAKKYPAHKYNHPKISIKVKLQGQNCWGLPMTQPAIDTNAMTRMTQEEICTKVNGYNSIPYPDWEAFYKNCTKAVCKPENVEYYNQATCDKMKCDKLCMNTHNMDMKCVQCRYNIDNLDNCVGDCKRIKTGVSCHEACDTYKNMRLKGVDQSDASYMAVKDKCKSDMCARMNFIKCKTCMSNCEKLGRRVYNSMLGTNVWRTNFNGWGCNYPCNAAHISKITEFRGVDINDPGQIGFTRAFDAMSLGAMDWDHMASLKEWAKGGWRADVQ